MKKRKQMREDVAFNRRIFRKGQHGSSKLHTISNNLTAATLAAFGRCHWRQALMILLKRLSLMCPFKLVVSISLPISPSRIY